jgi:hypothetical protein
LTETISELANSRFIISSNVTVDFRTEKIGLIKGSLIFINGSELFFKEYLDLRYKIEKLSYSFHYQDKDCLMIFRYDNAAHKPSLGFKEHKHVFDKIFQSEIPNLKEIMEEIINDHLTI